MLRTHCWQASGTTYVCICNAGWTGVQCNQAVNPCASQPCQNNGTCVSHLNGTFTCTCTSSFTGTLCQTAQRGTATVFQFPAVVREYTYTKRRRPLSTVAHVSGTGPSLASQHEAVVNDAQQIWPPLSLPAAIFLGR